MADEGRGAKGRRDDGRRRGRTGSSSRGSAPGGRGGRSRSGPGGRSGRGRSGGARSGGSRRSGRGGEKGRDDRLAGPQPWGRLARRGAGRLGEDDERPPAGGGRSAAGAARTDGRGGREPEVTARRVEGEEAPRRKRPTPPLVADAVAAVERGRSAPPPRARKPLAARPARQLDPHQALVVACGERRGTRLARRLDEAAEAFADERFDDARRLLTAIVREAPDVAEVRELLGLTYYRLGRWSAAIDQLERFRELTGSTEQHPVLADCHRALGRWDDVEELWHELGEQSPSAALVTEGRIVRAGALADRGDLAGAVRELEKGWRPPKRPRPHHLRRAYALADLYERAGSPTRARELFAWVAHHDPGLADVTERVRSLS